MSHSEPAQGLDARRVLSERHIDRKLHVVTEWNSVENFTTASSIPAGVNSISSGGVPIDVMFQPKGERTTVVVFNGAPDGATRLPHLVGGGALKGVPANRILLSDPSLYLSPDLTLAWFAGSAAQPALQSDLAKIIDTMLRSSGCQNVIFFGSSGAGFAALAYSKQFPGSACVAVNPQTRVDRYYAELRDRYVRLAWNAENITLLPRQVRIDMVDEYARGFTNHVAYIQNTRDSFHVRNHQEPFIAGARGRGALYVGGAAWGASSDDGHVPPPEEVLSRIFASLTECDGRWDQGIESLGLTRL